MKEKHWSVLFNIEKNRKIKKFVSRETLKLRNMIYADIKKIILIKIIPLFYI